MSSTPSTAPSDLERALRKEVAGDVRFDAGARVLYSTDASNYQVYPLGAVFPRNEQDVMATMQVCAERGVPVTARGGGSGLAGQSIGPGIVIDTSMHMHAMLETDEQRRRVRVQPGMVLGLLNNALRPRGLQFGPDPASAERATVGGILGTNATGAHSIRYGMTSDNVESLRCVMADGSVREFGPQALAEFLRDPVAGKVARVADACQGDIAARYPRVWRRASGYNLDYIAEQLAVARGEADATALFPWNHDRVGNNFAIHREAVSTPNLAPLIAGSEGSLAFVVEATLRLVPLPTHKALVLATFSCALPEAMNHVQAMLSLTPSAIELLGDQLLRNAHALPEYARLMPWADLSAEATLAIEFDGESEAEVAHGVAAFESLVASERMPCTLQVLHDRQAQNNVWTVRKMGQAILASVRGDYKPIAVVEDVAVPVARLGEFVTEIRRIFRDNGTDGVFYAHASAGVLHVRPMVNLKSLEGLQAMRGISHAAMALCERLGGAMSGEHGDGYERTWQNEVLFGPALSQAFADVKAAFDPTGLLNPGKKVHALGEAQLEQMMKLGPGRRTRAFATAFRYDDANGINGLAEECFGSGVCRKQDSGAMCPSYRVTLDEAHSTRGRANLLRDFMMGLGKHDAATAKPGATDDQRPALQMADVKAALDLCLSCKACNSECASRVDMAKMKSDFLQLHHDTHGLPMRSWVLGRIAPLSALATLLPEMANRVMSLPAFKRVLNISAARPMPKFAAQPFEAWWRKHAQPASGHEVVLFVDTFARYNHPEIAIAAVEVLEQMGFRVTVPNWRCCGRPLVSTGQPRAALGWARHNVQVLAPFAKRGVPILGLEPSCISMLREDYPSLLPGDDAAAVAGAVQSVEAFVAPNLEALPVFGGNVLFHQHCHQRASYGPAGTVNALQRAGFAVTETPPNCCGMAGAFGFEAEHYDISKRVGELSTLPAVRASADATTICATGTSCRQQISDFTGRQARHPIQVIADAMGLVRSQASPHARKRIDAKT